MRYNSPSTMFGVACHKPNHSPIRIDNCSTTTTGMDSSCCLKHCRKICFLSGLIVHRPLCFNYLSYDTKASRWSYLPHRGPNRPCPRIYAFDPGEGQVKSITMGHS
nr:hypothetical protein Iba_chr14dCG0290 [Ipomoea batatas]